MQRFVTRIILGAALLAPAAIVPSTMLADDHVSVRFEDRYHHDWHDWNDGEDRAYRRWREDQHRTYIEFRRLKAREQQQYWRWRHDHPDHG